MGDDGEQVFDRHQAEAERLRTEIEQLVKRARLLLHGQPNAARPPMPRAPHPRRAERDKELEQALEKADWFRREIKRMRQELDTRDQMVQTPWPADSTDRDPMELYNLLAEKRRELQQLKLATEGLDRAAEAQRKAESAQSYVPPELEEKLRRTKHEVEQQKKLNVKLQADRLKLSSARKAAEEELRAVGSEVRTKAALLQRPAQSSRGASPHKGSKESDVIAQLKREIDILQGALRQDDRKHKAMLKEDSQEVDSVSLHVQSLQKDIEEREARIAKLRATINGDAYPSSHDLPLATDPQSPFGRDASLESLNAVRQ
eukprot:TRINITY_DN83275_c0_g1_i1.p1 TRINITY_DN83275_c0_g1~~TRINITY_DN83275_c0_g1_i1.p1  ORF type:complete len:317 (-),score=68.95 TRINITY_DN83275_c0_g1_i1:58-1008(-)